MTNRLLLPMIYTHYKHKLLIVISDIQIFKNIFMNSGWKKCMHNTGNFRRIFRWIQKKRMFLFKILNYNPLKGFLRLTAV